jgi:chemotaxis methyl-accepting protein methylase
MEDLVPAFAYLCRQSCRYPVDSRPLSSVMSWPDLLVLLSPFPSVFNPALLLRQLATEEVLRRRFLFCLSIPRSFGGGFGRYPRQTVFLANWLASNRERLAASATVLDAACGCGEGTYEVAEVLLAQGYGRSTRIDGSTLEPLELFAAAFGCFPHDPARGEAFRERVSPILDRGGGEMIRFYREDICAQVDVAERYDVILCNGLLGGPLFHGKEQLAGGIGRLAARLRPGGVLLVADRFHQGWKMKQQEEVLSLLRDNNLDVVEAGEGVAGVTCGTAVHPRRARRQNP